MSQITGEMEGLMVDTIVDPSDRDEFGPIDEVASLILAAYHSYNRGQIKASMSKLVDACNMGAQIHHLSCGASL